MRIRLTTSDDLDRVMDIYAAARAYMASHGNPTQWAGGHPARSLVEEDIRLGRGLVGTGDDDVPHCAFALVSGADPTYQRIYDGAWLDDEPYLTLHRVASDGELHGVVGAFTAYAHEQAKRAGLHDLRIDTHADNATMHHAAEQAGFVRCGVIHLPDGTERVAYQMRW